MQVFDYYQPLDEEIYRPYSGKIVVWSCFWDMFVKVVYPDGVEKLSCEEFLNCIRSGYADPEAFKEEASKIQAELEKPSDENG